MPNDGFLVYTYDAAHRLTDITDNFANRIHYTLDLLGNRTTEDTFDSQGVLTQTQSRVFDQLNRLRQALGAGNQATRYDYDANGNLISTIDPLNHPPTLNGYDALDRLVKITDPAGGVTDYSFDAQDRLTQVTDPKRLVTSYVYNGLGDLKTLTSPDTGTTQNTYDAAGNLKTSQDARSQLTSYTYDKLNRLTKVTYADATVTSFQYDLGTQALGRLNKLFDTTGNTQWTYDQQGRVRSKIQQTGTISKTVRYDYDSQGQLTSMTYPSGQVIGYRYTQGRLSGMTVDGQVLLSHLSYQPFGPVKGWQWGNGSAFTRSFDRDGRLMTQTLGSGTRTVTYDAASRITGLTVPSNQTLGYDALDRLTSYLTSTTNQAYTYDADGNRLTHTVGTTPAYTYSYPATDNKLISTSGPTARSYTFDAAGNTLTDGRNTFTYNARGRLNKVTYGISTNTYFINGLGQRVRKNGAGVPTSTNYFVYDEQGQLIGEYDSTGTPIQETIYLNDIPVAISQGTTTYYIHADHLNTPRAITDSTNKVIWRWNSDPFGTTPAAQDPDQDGVKFTYHLRFPGQYYDKEAGLHYNYFRDYDPKTGRYIQSDPIGLAGGVNTYGYVGGNPISYTDPMGLWRNPWDINNDAGRDARASGLPGSHNGPQDAYRHCLASCEMARESTGPVAQCLGWANEKKGDWWRNQERGERQMDDFNNSVGVKLGGTAQSYQACQAACMGAATSGGLRTYQPGTTPGYWY